jgi:DNA end-binding protein Ku
VPDEGGAKAFALLQEALREAGRVAVGKVVLREKEHVVSLRPYDAAMVMSTLYYPDEVRAVSGLDEVPVDVKVHPNERKMAGQLIESLAIEFQPEDYKDEYRQALLALIEAKGKGEPVPEVKAKEPGKVVDLMEALRRSVEMAKQRPPAARASRAAGGERRAAAGGMHERPR